MRDATPEPPAPTPSATTTAMQEHEGKTKKDQQQEPLPSRDATVSDTALLDLLEARGVVSIYFADGSQLNAGSLSARAAIACLRFLHTEASC